MHSDYILLPSEGLAFCKGSSAQLWLKREHILVVPIVSKPHWIQLTFLRPRKRNHTQSFYMALKSGIFTVRPGVVSEQYSKWYLKHPKGAFGFITSGNEIWESRSDETLLLFVNHPGNDFSYKEDKQKSQTHSFQLLIKLCVNVWWSQCGIVDKVPDKDSGNMGSKPCSSPRNSLACVATLWPFLEHLTYLKPHFRVTGSDLAAHKNKSQHIRFFMNSYIFRKRAACFAW